MKLDRLFFETLNNEELNIRDIEGVFLEARRVKNKLEQQGFTVEEMNKIFFAGYLITKEGDKE